MQRLLHTAAVATLLVAGSFATYASPALAAEPAPVVSQSQPRELAPTGECETHVIQTNAAGNIVEQIDADTRTALSNLMASQGKPRLPQATSTIETTPSGGLIALDAQGNRLGEWSLTSASTSTRAKGVFGTQPASADSAGSWLKGAARGFAKAVAGCVGGVIGFDAILGVLEKRVSYWAFVKWLGGKVGWGLAVSCAAGAATAVLGW